MNNGGYHHNPNPRNNARRNENAGNKEKGCCSNKGEVKFDKGIDQGGTVSTESSQEGNVTNGKDESLPDPSLST